MNVNELLDTIEDTLEESAGMPLSGGKRIVDVEQIRDYLDEIRQNLPVELRQAQSIVSDRAQLIDSANAQAQAIVKKAASRRLGEKYGVSWLPETGAKYQLQFSIMNDRVHLYLDTSGQGLHKRGYRAVGNDAPLRETLAAAMVQLTRYRGREFLWDPFCGSGTIPIEAALIARNAAPGGRRRFAAEAFAWCDGKVWDEVREEAKAKEFHGKYQILGSDNDPKCVSLAMANARKAGVGDIIRFADGDATKMDLPAQSGILIGNPPYGQRMLEQQSAQRLYAALGRHLKYADGWKKFIITSEPEFEHYFGRRADKKRKLYNGMIKCDYYMYTDNSRKNQKRDDKK